MTRERRPRWYDSPPPAQASRHNGRPLEAGAALGAAIGVGLLVAGCMWVLWWLS